MQVRQAAELEQAHCHGREVDRECPGRDSDVVAHDLRVQQSDPGRGRKQKHRVGDQVEPRAGRRRLAKPARHEPVEDVGQAGEYEPRTDQAAVAEQGVPPEDRHQEQAQPGDTVRHPPTRPVHERSLARGRYL